MSKAQSCLLVCAWICWRSSNVHVAAIATVDIPHWTRRLQQAATSDCAYAGVRVANVSTLPEDFTEGVVDVPEFQLNGRVNISSISSEAPGDWTVPYGTHYLGPAEVQDLVEIITTELALVPPSQARVTPRIQFPGVKLRGVSVLDTLSTKQPLRIPTVIAPFHAGTIFRLDSRDAPPGVTLNFSNMTLLLPNVTYEGIYDSGFMDFFDIGTAARFCFTNSILVLKSCEGFLPNKYHLWCCTQRQCNILYTQQAIEDLGYNTGNLELIKCFSVDAAAVDPEQGDMYTGWAADCCGVAAGVVASVLVALAALCVFVRYHRGRSHRMHQLQGAAQEVQQSKGESMVASDGAPGEMRKTSPEVRASHSTTATSPVASDVSVGVHTQTCGLTTSGAARTDAYNTAAAALETTAAQQKARLVAELDHMRLRRELFLGQFVVLPCTERREGGQGVVQFMRRVRSEEAVAVKFFFSRAAFETEGELYRVAVLRSMMPEVQLQVANADAAERNGSGYPWPPCMVLEKGESLQEWKAKTRPAFSTILDALCLIAERLAQLHGSGWVHRDLKPGNIIFLPSRGAWTLIDFGLAARAGCAAPDGHTPGYAPPEIIAAHDRGVPPPPADPATDAWALAVMAFELLTGHPAFDWMTGSQQAYTQLRGDAPLPWEGERLTDAVRAKLGVLRSPILETLNRDPAARPPCSVFCDRLRAAFSADSSSLRHS